MAKSRRLYSVLLHGGIWIDKISSIRNESLKIKETEIPVSRSYRESFFKEINEKNKFNN